MARTKNKKKRSAVAAYGKYIARIQDLAAQPVTSVEWQGNVTAALNGQASTELRRLISLKTRRRFGAFFTGSKLAEKFIASCPVLPATALVHDPSVGIGDLLLAAASQLPLQATLEETLRQWGEQLSGTDLHPEFVRGAKVRLSLLARQRHGIESPAVSNLTGLFPRICVSDGLDCIASYQRATHLFLNPPFGLVDAPEDCTWAGGRITAAAIFVAKALEQAQPGAVLLAILPDVLRSGSFTALWRQRIAELAEIELIKPYGIFDETADVDVFLLRTRRRSGDQGSANHAWPSELHPSGANVGDFFDVHVGRVVPHRDPETGPEHPYIHPKGLPTWETMRVFTETRKHEGKVYKPPFVVIRRTSRPGHLYRAAATIIAGKKPVAVENHLIVCMPKDGTYTACKNLMRLLKTKETNEFLDNRIRCRHLTVDSVATIPFLT